MADLMDFIIDNEVVIKFSTLEQCEALNKAYTYVSSYLPKYNHKRRNALSMGKLIFNVTGWLITPIQAQGMKIEPDCEKARMKQSDYSLIMQVITKGECF